MYSPGLYGEWVQSKVQLQKKKKSKPLQTFAIHKWLTVLSITLNLFYIYSLKHTLSLND